MILTTRRLILRPWEDADAPSLYTYAKDPAVGPIAGWTPHTSVEYSREIIRTVLGKPGTFAICLKDDPRPIGSIGLMGKDSSNLVSSDAEAEIGYWIGVPFWGQGLVPEAVKELIRFSFEVLNLDTLWCGYFDGNERSKRVQEKCGFTHHHTTFYLRLNKNRVEHVTRLTRNTWESSRPMTAEAMWNRFCAAHQIENAAYTAWAFGGAPDALADLVLKGIKTGTASAYELYALDDSEPMPKAGDYSVVLNSADEAVCVIQTTKVYLSPFSAVTAEHAWKEGEGDRTLAYWRKVHRDFFQRELADYGLIFSENTPVLCEEFIRLYP